MHQFSLCDFSLGIGQTIGCRWNALLNNQYRYVLCAERYSHVGEVNVSEVQTNNSKWIRMCSGHCVNILLCKLTRHMNIQRNNERVTTNTIGYGSAYNRLVWLCGVRGLHNVHYALQFAWVWFPFSAALRETQVRALHDSNIIMRRKGEQNYGRAQTVTWGLADMTIDCTGSDWLAGTGGTAKGWHVRKNLARHVHTSCEGTIACLCFASAMTM